MPQIPCRQEDSTSTPAPATASSTDISGATVTVVPVRASSTSNGAVRADAACSSATNRSVRSVCVGHPAQAASIAASSGPGPHE